jgi:hypothetical protein
MRPTVLVASVLAACAVFAVAARSGARAAPETDADARTRLLEAEVKALKADVEYLRSREASLTKHAVAFEAMAKAVLSDVGDARTQGFEAAAIAAPSRVAVLRALEAVAKGSVAGLPRPTPAEDRLHREADDARKAADDLAKSTVR